MTVLRTQDCYKVGETLNPGPSRMRGRRVKHSIMMPSSSPSPRVGEGGKGEGFRHPSDFATTLLRTPQRLLILKPCCIGDVIMATALLCAIRRAYPSAHITWAVSSNMIDVLRQHMDIQQVIDTGVAANPAKGIRAMLKLVNQLRSGNYDMVLVPDRSPLLGLATWLAGIPQRVGLDSAGRGWAYTHKAPIDPAQIRHEADIYLDLARCLDLPTTDCYVNWQPSSATQAQAQAVIASWAYPEQPFVMLHAGGGVNAGMTMLSKRWPPQHFATLANRLANALEAQVLLIGANSDAEAIQAVQAALKVPSVNMVGHLSLAVQGALAQRATLYLGNDNGVAHLAAAAGGKVLMIFGPSDPRRYAPFVPVEQARYAWRPTAVATQGVSADRGLSFDWKRDGVSVDEVWEQARLLLKL